jgi:taurine dioxygenase
MQVEKLSAPLGARITGLDVRDVDPATAVELDRLFCEHQVLVFPGQELKPEQHIEFASHWGDLVRHPYAGMDSYPEIIELKNFGKRKDVNQHWHTDMSYNEKPPKLTMLYAHEVPSMGGDTAFADQQLACEELSEGLRSTVDNLRALHSAEELANLYGEDATNAPRAEHPVVRTHDVTGRHALYVCRAFTKRFVGWSTRESKGLLDSLFEHSTRIEFQYRHQWSKGDLVMWDNRSVLHFAVHDHGDEPRTIHRLQVEGLIPL